MLPGGSCRVNALTLQDLAEKSRVMSSENQATNPGQVGGGAAGRQLAASHRNNLTDSRTP